MTTSWEQPLPVGPGVEVLQVPCPSNDLSHVLHYFPEFLRGIKLHPHTLAANNSYPALAALPSLTSPLPITICCTSQMNYYLSDPCLRSASGWIAINTMLTNIFETCYMNNYTHQTKITRNAHQSDNTCCFRKARCPMLFNYLYFDMFTICKSHKNNKAVSHSHPHTYITWNHEWTKNKMDLVSHCNIRTMRRWGKLWENFLGLTTVGSLLVYPRATKGLLWRGKLSMPSISQCAHISGGVNSA